MAYVESIPMIQNKNQKHEEFTINGGNKHEEPTRGVWTNMMMDLAIATHNNKLLDTIIAGDWWVKLSNDTKRSNNEGCS